MSKNKQSNNNQPESKIAPEQSSQVQTMVIQKNVWQWGDNIFKIEPATALEAEFCFSQYYRQIGRKASENLGLPFCKRLAV